MPCLCHACAVLCYACAVLVLCLYCASAVPVPCLCHACFMIAPCLCVSVPRLFMHIPQFLACLHNCRSSLQTLFWITCHGVTCMPSTLSATMYMRSATMDHEWIMNSLKGGMHWVGGLSFIPCFIKADSLLDSDGERFKPQLLNTSRGPGVTRYWVCRVTMIFAGLADMDLDGIIWA